MTDPAQVRVRSSGRLWRADFTALGGPCEVLCEDAESARFLGGLAAAEARRVESKFSRYRGDTIIRRINTAAGAPVTVDAETADLLDFAARCFEISDGLFDVTSGVLRRAWRFDGGDGVPAEAAVRDLLPLVGWAKVSWRRPLFAMPAGMEIDLGGIGKEYAVDRAAALVAEGGGAGCLISFGGDLRVTGPRRDGRPWDVAIEAPQREGSAAAALQLAAGALATSGDSRRFLLKDGVRYGHILDPRTGWPVRDAPRSATVLADSCTEAGMLATLAMLKGEAAEDFLREQGARHWVMR